jgi:hypothetical protein
MITVEYDPASDLPYGVWRCPKTGDTFYGGGPPCCGCPSYEGHVYCYSPQERQRVARGKSLPLVSVAVESAIREALRRVMMITFAP